MQKLIHEASIDTSIRLFQLVIRHLLGTTFLGSLDYRNTGFDFSPGKPNPDKWRRMLSITAVAKANTRKNYSFDFNLICIRQYAEGRCPYGFRGGNVCK